MGSQECQGRLNTPYYIYKGTNKIIRNKNKKDKNMKKYIFSVLMAAMAAFTFSSCEDVPEPYTLPTQPEAPGENTDPNQKGSESNPYTVAEAIALIKAGTAPSTAVCVKGKITAVTFFNATYSSLSYNIADEGSSDVIEVYSGKGKDGANFSSMDDLKVGQIVVVKGIVKAFTKNDGTIVNEIDKNSTIISIENAGTTTPDTPATGKGSLSDPYNVAEAIAAIKAGTAPTTQVYLTGIISDVAFYNEQYKSITYYISDDGKSKDMQVYSGKGLNGKDFASKEELKVGQKVTILGKIMKFTDKNGNEIMEVDKTSSIIKIEDGGSTTPDTPSVNDGTEAKPFSVTEVIAKGFDPATKGVYIKAYIIGSATGKDFTTLTFTTEGASGTNIGIAANATESNASNCIPVQLPKGAVRDGVNLSANPGNFKQEIILYGDIDKYFGMVGIKNVTYAKIGDKIYGKKP